MDIERLAKEISMNQLLSMWNELDKEGKEELFSYIKTGNNESLKFFLRHVIVTASTFKPTK